MKTKLYVVLLYIALIASLVVEPFAYGINGSLIKFEWSWEVYSYRLIEIIFFCWIYIPIYWLALYLLHKVVSLLRNKTVGTPLLFIVGIFISQIPCLFVWLTQYNFGFWEFRKYGLTYLITGTVATWLYYLWV